MKAFDRQPQPAFWADRVCRWVDLLATGETPVGNKLHDWSENKLTLAEWFHDTVRPAGEGALCSYCDGLLGTQSPASDVDEVEALIVCDPATGRLEPAATVIDEALRRCVEETLVGLGLNRAGLVRERWLIARSLLSGPIESLLDRAVEGPYRFLATQPA